MSEWFQPGNTPEQPNEGTQPPVDGATPPNDWQANPYRTEPPVPSSAQPPVAPDETELPAGVEVHVQVFKYGLITALVHEGEISDGQLHIYLLTEGKKAQQKRSCTGSASRSRGNGSGVAFHKLLCCIPDIYKFHADGGYN